jgi:hypothetical protein
VPESHTSNGDLPVYIDMRTIGSTGGIYADSSIPLPERATRLLMDTLGSIHSGLLEFATNPEGNLNLGVLSPLLEELADEITKVAVIGDVSHGAIHVNQNTQTSELKTDLGIKGKELSFGLSDSIRSAQDQKNESRFSEKGVIRHRVHFGAVGQILSRITNILRPRRIWILIDEWSVLPNELQPLLADLLRRSLFPVRGLTVKIGAIEQRATFQIAGEHGDYIGIELGADISADIGCVKTMSFFCRGF